MLTHWKIFIVVLLVFFLTKNISSAQVNKNKEANKYYREALIFEAEDNLPLAELYYKKAIQSKGVHTNAEYRLSYLLAGQLKFAAAADAMGKYLKHSNAGEKEYESLVELKHAARLQASISSDERPKLEDLLEFIHLVSIYGKNRMDDALPFAQKATTLYPDSGEALLSHAAILNKSYPKQKTKELELISKALLITPDNPKGHYQLGKFYEIDDRNKAILEFQKALESSSGKLIQAWYDLGIAYMFSGNNIKAVEALKTYLKLATVPAPIREEIERKIKLLS